MSSTNSPTAKFTFFCLPSSSEIKFQLMYWLNCNLPAPEGTFTTIYLYLESSNKEQVSIEYRLSIGKEKHAKTQEGEETFSIAKQMRYGALFNINQDYLLDPENALITSYKDNYGKRVEQLTICCEIKEIEMIFKKNQRFVWLNSRVKHFNFIEVCYDNMSEIDESA